MTKRHASIMATTVMFWASSIAQADEPPHARAPVVQQLFDCRTMVDPMQRLACFDRQVAALESAEQARDIRIVDRETVREARRGLFGFSLGSLNIFGSGDNDEEAADPEVIREIQSTIQQIARNNVGRFAFQLENGQRWTLADAAAGGRTPRVGEPITIRRGAMGSYMASVNGRPGFRVRREQ